MGRLAIPYLGPRGNTYGMKFKCMDPHDHKDKEIRCPKVLSWDGLPDRMYNTQALQAPTDYIFLAEGEPDAWTFEACGWPSVGLPGVEKWRDHHARMLAGFSKVILLAHGDEAGKRLAVKVRKALPSTSVIIQCDVDVDANSHYITHGKEGLKALIGEGMSDDE